MQQTLPKKLFLTVTKNLNSEDPTWALLIVNEYLDSNDPLRKALVQKANKPQHESDAYKAACEGKTLSELPSVDQLALRRSRSTLRSKVRSIPTPRMRVTQRRAIGVSRFAVNA